MAAFRDAVETVRAQEPRLYKSDPAGFFIVYPERRDHDVNRRSVRSWCRLDHSHGNPKRDYVEYLRVSGNCSYAANHHHQWIGSFYSQGDCRAVHRDRNLQRWHHSEHYELCDVEFV